MYIQPKNHEENRILSQKVPNKEDLVGIMKFCIQIRDLSNVVCDHKQKSFGDIRIINLKINQSKERKIILEKLADLDI